MGHFQAESGAPGAEIIPFPSRAALVVPTGDSPEISPEERLRQALVMLAAAQQAQREAVGRWRDALVSLTHNLSDLGVTLADAQHRLLTIAVPPKD